MGTSNRAMLIDVGANVLMVAAVCLWSHHLVAMTSIVLMVHLVRILLWSTLVNRSERGWGLGTELILVVGCTLIGGLNDWNTVDRHHVYSYGVPTDLGGLSSIPAWMLLFWGLIVRSIASLVLWRGLGEITLADSVRLPWGRLNGWGYRVGLLVVLVVVTRQLIYRLWGDPWLSWLPFALALGAYIYGLGMSVRLWRLAGVFVVLGPVVESILINVGHLHSYRLGWFGGVPLWITLWWVLAVLIFAELAPRLASRASLKIRASSGQKAWVG